jgi:phosphoglycolate phosphatase
MYRLVIFDLDGTLVDSLRDLATAINTSLEKMGLPTHQLEEFNYYVGNGIKKLCERSLDSTQQHRVEELHTLFTEYYSTHYAVYTKPYPHVLELLTTLKSQDVKVAVASNKAESFVKQIVSELFPSVEFDCVKGQVDSREKKPAPDIVLDTLRELGIPKEEAILVGDSNVDILTAKNAGVQSIGCLWGFRDYAELSQAQADSIISDPLEVLEVLKQ